MNIEEKKPSRWLAYLVYWFRLGLILFVVISALLGTTGCTYQKVEDVTWRKATSITNSETLTEIVKNHTSNLTIPIENVINDMQAWSYQTKTNNLTIYQLNNPNLCGYIGCLYLGFLQPNQNTLSSFSKEVFSVYIKPNLPPNVSLLKVKKDEQKHFSEFPCLVFNQLDSNEYLQEIKYCFNGHLYQLTDKRLLPLK